MKKEISIQEQIEILGIVKTKIIARTEDFICNGIQDVLFNMKIIKRVDYGHFDPSLYINLCTSSNAKIVCIERNLDLPWAGFAAWWDYSNWEVRVVFIEWMIKELENKL